MPARGCTRRRTLPAVSLGDSSALVLSGDTVSLFPNAHVVVDVEEFERSAKQAIAALDRDPEGCAAAAAAADRWAGELLPDDPYEAWLEDPRDRLRQLHQELLRRSGRWGELALADPADEEASLARARQLADSGNRGAALRQLERLERALAPRTGRQPRPCGGVTAGRVARIRRSREAASSGESCSSAVTPSYAGSTG